MHLNSELIFTKYGLSRFRSGLKVLEIAPASFPSRYQALVNDPSITWETIDFVSTEYIDQAAVNNLTYELKSPYSFRLKMNLTTSSCPGKCWSMWRKSGFG
jgi:hypothetical protein